MTTEQLKQAIERMNNCMMGYTEMNEKKKCMTNFQWLLFVELTGIKND